MNRIRLIATDLDGTLVHSSGTITPRNIAAVERVQKLGIEVALCTGRRHSYALRAAHRLRRNEGGVIISSNGAVTRTAAGELYWRCSLSLDIVVRMCAALHDFRNALVITYDRFQPDGGDATGALLLEEIDHLHGSIRSWMEINATSIRRVPRLEDALLDAGEEPIQAMLCGGMKRMQRAERLLQEQFAGELDTYRTEYPGKDLCILDILRKGRSKGSALLQLAERRNVHVEEILAIGDNWNDEPMLRVAGHSVVLQNAPDDLKQHALQQGWQVGKEGDLDGFSEAIDRLLP